MVRPHAAHEVGNHSLHYYLEAAGAGFVQKRKDQGPWFVRLHCSKTKSFVKTRERGGYIKV